MASNKYCWIDFVEWIIINIKYFLASVKYPIVRYALIPFWNIVGYMWSNKEHQKKYNGSFTFWIPIVWDGNLMVGFTLPLSCCFSKPGNQGLVTWVWQVVSRMKRELRSPGWFPPAFDSHDLTRAGRQHPQTMSMHGQDHRRILCTLWPRPLGHLRGLSTPLGRDPATPLPSCSPCLILNTEPASCFSSG